MILWTWAVYTLLWFRRKNWTNALFLMCFYSMVCTCATAYCRLYTISFYMSSVVPSLSSFCNAPTTHVLGIL
jgi:hypothetical protein